MDADPIRFDAFERILLFVTLLLMWAFVVLGLVGEAKTDPELAAVLPRVNAMMFVLLGLLCFGGPALRTGAGWLRPRIEPYLPD